MSSYQEELDKVIAATVADQFHANLLAAMSATTIAHPNWGPEAIAKKAYEITKALEDVTKKKAQRYAY